MNIRVVGKHSEHTEVDVTHSALQLACALCSTIRYALGVAAWWKIEQGPEKTRIVSFEERDGVKSKTIEVENPTPLQLRALTTCLEFQKLIEDVENEKNSVISALPASVRNLVGL